MNTAILYVTAPNKAEAETIAETVVQEKLAACGNILDGMTSIYEWEDRLCKESEALLILKTTAHLENKLIERIKHLHSYECPCVISLPIQNGNSDFLKWISESTQTER